MYQREALWLAFGGRDWHPCAVQICVGGVNAISGDRCERLSAAPQNYLVAPDQLWLDGIKSGDGVIRQFVAAPLGSGHTIEAQLTGREQMGGIQIRLHGAKSGRFPDRAPPRREVKFLPIRSEMASSTMGLGAGGRMKQKIYPDHYGIESWEPDAVAVLHIYLVSSDFFRQITGSAPPLTPVSAEAYTARGLPWFEFYEEDRADVQVQEALARVRSIAEMEGPRSEDPVAIEPGQIRRITTQRGRRKLGCQGEDE